jgi:hypothetical protein
LSIRQVRRSFSIGRYGRVLLVLSAGALAVHHILVIRDHFAGHRSLGTWDLALEFVVVFGWIFIGSKSFLELLKARRAANPGN